MKLFVCGESGRMAQSIRELASKNPKVQMLKNPEKHCVIVDFTAPTALPTHLELALEYQAGYMLGTTGLTAEHKALLQKASEKIAILQASNTSLGANVLFALTRLASKALKDSEMHITDIHHVHKKDAPSGTALSLQEASGRSSEITSIRTESVVGVHEVVFTSPFETLSLKHEANDRAVFAEGALLAAFFLSKQKPGLYHMQDVLGL